ncbi:MAG: hemolysin family protein [Chloroflexota bacterium]
MSKLPALGLGVSGFSFLLGMAAGAELPRPDTLIMPGLIIALLIILNGLFVAAEFAIIAVRPTRIEQLANEGHPIARLVLPVLESPDRQNRYIATAQVGITMASLGLGMYGEPQIGRFVEPYLAWLLGRQPHETVILSLGYIIAVSLLTYLHIVIGEMIPKSLSLSKPDKTALAIARFMQVMQFVFSVPVRLLNSIGALILNIFRIPPAEGHARLHSPEELELIVTESAGVGLLNQAEEEMIRNIFDFVERRVHQVMTPRPRVEALPHDLPLPTLLELAAASHFSRFPVYEADLDHIIGIVHLKDLVRQQLRRKGNFDIRLLLRPVHIVPEYYPVKRLLTVFKRQRVHMAIVLDEYGGTAGVVTLEDLIEEVVGEVRDEFDLENEPLIELGRGKLEVAGDYLVDDLAEYVDLGQEEDLPDVETVGGLIMARLGRVSLPGDTVTLNEQVHFKVLTVDGLAVTRVSVEYSPPPEPDSNKGAM